MFRKISIGVLMLLFLVACQQEQPNASKKPNTEIKQNSKEDLETDSKKVVIKPQKIETFPVSLYDQTEFDLDRDGENERIEMYVNAEKDDKGEFMWDDGHNWLFVVKDGEHTYPLFDGWVQLGKLSFWLIESNGTPMIILLKTGTAEFNLQTFTFNAEESGFIQEVHFNPENVNFWHHSQ
jgi:hypothetical protein